MVPKRIMLVAGETSGDILAAELVRALRTELPRWENDSGDDRQPLHASLQPVFFGAGGPRMAAEGVDLAFDMTRHAVVGLSDVIKNLGFFRERMAQLVRLAEQRQPHAIICVDFSGFNLRLAKAIRRRIRSEQGAFYNWKPKIIQFVSPQVWASRPGRARDIERNIDLLLSILPFEKDWYARHAPGLKVEFVGHPIIDRCQKAAAIKPQGAKQLVLLLPGSRNAEIRRHVPVMTTAARLISAKHEVDFRMVLPDPGLAALAKTMVSGTIQLQVGGLVESLQATTIAIASTGTVMLECACFGVPTVALYKTSWLTYEVGKRLINVNYLAMPNLLANEAVFPEFIQNDATAENISAAAIDLLNQPERCKLIKQKLSGIVSQLGPPGAAYRAARAITREILAGGF